MTVQEIFAEHAAVLRAAAASLAQPLDRAIAVLGDCLGAGGKVLACGNGGSAASAQHLVAELVCRFQGDRRALAAVALTADTVALTAIANDYGYARVFARQVEALAERGDVLVALSTSGNSGNVIEATKAAHLMGGTVIALTGLDGGALAPLADITLRVPSPVTARIQEVHDIFVHAIAQALEEQARRGVRA